MLTAKGLNCKQLIKPIGTKRKDDAQWVEVLYDKEYVYEKIKLEIIDPLRLEDTFFLVDLILKVWSNSNKRTDDTFDQISNILLEEALNEP